MAALQNTSAALCLAALCLTGCGSDDTLRGAEFAPDSVTLDPDRGILTLSEGDGFFADRSLTVFLFDDDAKLGDRSYRVDGESDGAPQLHLAYHDEGMRSPDTDIVAGGYRMTLELGEAGLGGNARHHRPGGRRQVADARRGRALRHLRRPGAHRERSRCGAGAGGPWRRALRRPLPAGGGRRDRCRPARDDARHREGGPRTPGSSPDPRRLPGSGPSAPSRIARGTGSARRRSARGTGPSGASARRSRTRARSMRCPGAFPARSSARARASRRSTIQACGVRPVPARNARVRNPADSPSAAGQIVHAQRRVVDPGIDHRLDAVEPAWRHPARAAPGRTSGQRVGASPRARAPAPRRPAGPDRAPTAARAAARGRARWRPDRSRRRGGRRTPRHRRARPPRAGTRRRPRSGSRHRSPPAPAPGRWAARESRCADPSRTRAPRAGRRRRTRRRDAPPRSSPGRAHAAAARCAGAPRRRAGSARTARGAGNGMREAYPERDRRRRPPMARTLRPGRYRDSRKAPGRS